MRPVPVLLAAISLMISTATPELLAQSSLCFTAPLLVLDTIQVSVNIGTSISSESFGHTMTMRNEAAKQTGQLAWFAVVTRSATGGTDYTVVIPSIVVSGDGLAIDGISTNALFSLIDQATVQRGVELGFTVCNAGCPGTTYTRVWQPACVERAGTGVATHFLTCNSDCGYRQYNVCCEEGLSEITLTGTMGGICGTPQGSQICEPTTELPCTNCAGGQLQ